MSMELISLGRRSRIGSLERLTTDALFVIFLKEVPEMGYVHEKATFTGVGYLSQPRKQFSVSPFGTAIG